MTVEADKKELESIVREMAEAQSADEIMQHWASDIKWFDISAENVHGFDEVHAEFDRQFGKLVRCGADFVELDVYVSGDLGFVRSVQKFWADAKDGSRHDLLTRQTDCFERRDGRWLEIHQHISLPQRG